MARPKRKGEAGAARNYITRNQAVRKLQLSLPDFRKLCIWKGIYPREPRSKKKVSKSSTSSTTFYYVKDIQYLLHEPLVNRFREQKALEKKISRALGRGDVTDAKRFERNAARPEKTGRPRYTLDHVIRERYPTFVDSLRDLDDCLSMLFLFANLPSTSSVPAKMIARCERLCLEFQHYLIVSHSLRKSFLSIKGVYFQANIQGETVTWLVPYKFNQRVVGDIDFRIMGTFVEFYMTLLGFVNFRLYTGVGLKYPPKFDQLKDNGAGELGAFTLEDVNATNSTAQAGGDDGEEAERSPDPKVQAEVNKLVQELKDEEEGSSNNSNSNSKAAVVETADDNEEVPSDAIDKFEPAAQGGDVLPQPSYSASNPRQLFSKCTIYLSRETPRGSIEFLLRAFGCKRVGWDAVLGEGAYTTNEMDPNITHQIVDRPPVQVTVNEETGGDGEDNQTAQKLVANRRVAGRIYVQPQWVWDSVNAEELLQPDLYAPGAQLPPHLSPFVKSVQGQYDPSLPLDQQQTDMEALESDGDEEDADEDDEEEDDGNGDKAVAKAVAKVKEAKEVKEAKRKAITKESDDDSDGGMDVAGTDDEDEDDEDDDDDDEITVRPDVIVDALEEEEDDEEEADSALQRQLELEAELSGKPVRSNGKAPLDARAKAKANARKALARDAKQKEDELERAKGMLPKKKRRLYEQMVYTNTKRSAEDEKLRAKRRKLERKQAKGSAGKA
ncbi:mRNA-binding ribosome synthesis protein nop7 [Sporothrix curviconia]|uniref:Pescadillo homolog n=1 Tax=Sporothrix curviconia TaxID=1260050 RepID=A0ABP0C4P1_9PEZI